MWDKFKLYSKLIKLSMWFTAYKLLNFDLSFSLWHISCLETSLREEKEELMTSSKASLGNIFGLHAELFLFLYSSVPRKFSLCTHVIWGISNTTSFSHSCFRYATNCSCMKLIFFWIWWKATNTEKKIKQGDFKLSP